MPLYTVNRVNVYNNNNNHTYSYICVVLNAAQNRCCWKGHQHKSQVL